MTWIISDGTTVHLGGEVEGQSLFAKLVRAVFARAKAGHGPLVDEGAIPSRLVPLDLNDLRQMHVWISTRANCFGLFPVSAPYVPKEQGEPADTAGLAILF